MTYPLVDRTLADDPVEHLADHTAQVEFYNMMMGHMDGTRATPFFVNVQHPDFGATCSNSTSNNDAPALNEAVQFATRETTVGPARAVWLPVTNSLGEKGRYYLDEPFRIHNGMHVWAYGARITASPRFDFITKFPTKLWNDCEQGLLEGYNAVPVDPIAGGRLAMGRFNLHGGLIECESYPGSIGAIFNMQQPSTWYQVRIDNAARFGLLLGGQQGIFHDLMIVGMNPDSGPSSTYPMIGLQLGMPDDVNAFPASFFWFFGANFESQYRGVYQHRAIGANVFRSSHFEGVDSTNPADPAYCFYLARGQLVIDEAVWFLAPTTNYGTFLHSQKASGATTPTYDVKHVFISGGGPPNDNAYALNDVDRGHTLKSWGDTKLSGANEAGIVRQINSLIGPSLADSAYPRPNVIYYAHDEGGYTAFGTYNRSTADADQHPLLRMRPGATQMGHLASWYDKTGTERFLITADGVPKLPGYTAATKPSATARARIMIYDLDTNKVQVSDGSAWINLH